LIRELTSKVAAADPDVIENHNLHGFDLPFLARRAQFVGVPLASGRIGPPGLRVRAARRGRTEDPEGRRVRCVEPGRELIDTMDASARSGMGAPLCNRGCERGRRCRSDARRRGIRPGADRSPAIRAARRRGSGHGRHRSASGASISTRRNGVAPAPGRGRNAPQRRRVASVCGGCGAPGRESGCRESVSVVDACIPNRPVP
jgi:DNA polymerase I